MADINHSVEISAKPEQVYSLVATGRGFGQWWATDITEAGDIIELGFFNRASIYRLRPAIEQSAAKAEWMCESGDEWSGTRIAFQMETTKTGTLLRFAHSGWRTASDYFIACNTTWGALMFRLKAAAEGKTPGPLFTREGWVA